MGNICFACNSISCIHMQQMMGAQQQQDMNQYYDVLRHMGNVSSLASNGNSINIVNANSNEISLPNAKVKKDNKKLLLLRRAT